MFDSGAYNLDQMVLESVFAMLSENLIYVSGALLCDPVEIAQPKEIRRVIGNIGQQVYHC